MGVYYILNVNDADLLYEGLAKLWYIRSVHSRSFKHRNANPTGTHTVIRHIRMIVIFTSDCISWTVVKQTSPFTARDL